MTLNSLEITNVAKTNLSYFVFMSSKLSDLYVFIFLELILDESAMVLRYRTRRVSP